jgi:hypothetical protein
VPDAAGTVDDLRGVEDGVLADDRLTVDAAATLMGLGRRQIYRLCRAFSADGPAGLASRKRGRPSNRKLGETFRTTVLSLGREQAEN